jgi:hypothetical protein
VKTESEFGCVLHRSPGPLAVVGYFFPDGEHGRREEVYRVSVERAAYDAAVKRIGKTGKTDRQKREALFLVFKP